MRCIITRLDKKEDKIIAQFFDNYDNAYDFPEEVYENIWFSDAYSNKPNNYKISEIKWLLNKKVRLILSRY